MNKLELFYKVLSYLLCMYSNHCLIICEKFVNMTFALGERFGENMS